jgi:hypothetical protein
VYSFQPCQLLLRAAPLRCSVALLLPQLAAIHHPRLATAALRLLCSCCRLQLQHRLQLLTHRSRQTNTQPHQPTALLSPLLLQLPNDMLRQLRA